MSQKHVSKIIFWTVLYKSSFTCIDSIFSLNLRLCTYISSKHVVWFRRLYKYYFGTVLWVYYTTITFVNHCRNWLGAADVAASAGALLLQVIEKTCCPHTTLCRTKTLPAKAHQSRAVLQMTVDHFGDWYGYPSYTFVIPSLL